MAVPRPLALVAHAIPIALAAVTAFLGATLLPFWPGVLVAAIVAGAALAAWIHPRFGLAIALAAPIFPLGNLSEGAATLYGALAVAWFLVSWRDARAGLLFVVGPLLAPLGVLALVPLAVQPARGLLTRALQAGFAVLTAALVAGLAGYDVPLTGEPAPSLEVGPLDSAQQFGLALARVLGSQPVLLAAALVVAVAAAILPLARRRWRYGVLAVGAALLVGAVVAGTGILANLIVALVWAFAGALAAGKRG